jgi:hypothetical protein
MSKGNTNGAVVWENEEICFVLTGLEKPSDNIKTGPMVQSYILRKDMHPNDAVKAGKDEAICGKCVFRGDGTGKGRGCYVNLAFGVGAVWRSLKNYCGRVSRLTGKALRLGAYGDPYFVPVDILRKYSNLAKKITGYTHQWREDDARARRKRKPRGFGLSALSLTLAKSMRMKSFVPLPPKAHPIKKLGIVSTVKTADCVMEISRAKK